jgi:hypothetical protein
MIHSNIYFLARETAEHLRSISSQIDADKQCIVASAFANDIEKLNGETLSEQWPGESDVRGLRFAPRLLGCQCERELRPLFEAACAAFGSVRWTEFYEEDDWSRSFLPKFANGEGIGPDGRLYHKDIILGLFVLGPNAQYPAHAHPAEEFYIVLAGKPSWQIGTNSSYHKKEPGAVVVHCSNESHSIRTNNEPLFAVFGWRGKISAKSWYRNDMTDNSADIKYPKIRKF